MADNAQTIAAANFLNALSGTVSRPPRVRRDISGNTLADTPVSSPQGLDYVEAFGPGRQSVRDRQARLNASLGQNSSAVPDPTGALFNLLAGLQGGPTDLAQPQPPAQAQAPAPASPQPAVPQIPLPGFVPTEQQQVQLPSAPTEQVVDLPAQGGGNALDSFFGQGAQEAAIGSTNLALSPSQRNDSQLANALRINPMTGLPFQLFDMITNPQVRQEKADGLQSLLSGIPGILGL